jgi:hypothetical protein
MTKYSDITYTAGDNFFKSNGVLYWFDPISREWSESLIIDKEEIYTLCPTHKDKWDRFAFIVGAIFLALMVFVLWRFW